VNEEGIRTKTDHAQKHKKRTTVVRNSDVTVLRHENLVQATRAERRLEDAGHGLFFFFPRKGRRVFAITTRPQQAIYYLGSEDVRAVRLNARQARLLVLLAEDDELEGGGGKGCKGKRKVQSREGI